MFVFSLCLLSFLLGIMMAGASSGCAKGNTKLVGLKRVEVSNVVIMLFFCRALHTTEYFIALGKNYCVCTLRLCTICGEIALLGMSRDKNRTLLDSKVVREFEFGLRLKT